MKVLLITKHTGNIGGLARCSLEIAKALRKKNIPFTILSEGGASTEPEEKTLLLPIGKGIRKIVTILQNCIITYHQTKRHSVVHAIEAWPYGLYAYIAILGRGKKFFISSIGTYSIIPLHKFGTKRLAKCVYLRAQRVFAISNYVKSLVNRLVPGANVSIVHLGRNTFPPLSNEENARFSKMFHITKDIFPLILTVGDIKSRKGQYNTLCALIKLSPTYPNYKYVMIGSDDDKFYLEKIEKKIKEAGQESHIKIISKNYDDRILAFFYSVCDLYALNSTNASGHFEGFGMTLIEAAAYGKPVIGSKGCGIEDAILNGKNGYLTTPKDSTDIAQKISDILSAQSENFGEESLIFARSFSWEKTVSAYVDAYEEELTLPKKQPIN